MALDDKIINLDINKTNILNLNAKQYDTDGARSFTFRLLKDGQIFDLTNLTVRVGGTKADGTTIFNDCTILDAKNGTVRVDLTTQMQVVAGNLNLELIIMQGTTRLSTVPFGINIIKSATNLKNVVSSNELNALNNALWKTDDVYNKQQIDQKVFSMANMGQDIKKAMTGGSVAVVGENAVNNENLVDGCITSNKLNNAFSNVLSFLKDDSDLNTIYKEGNYICVNPKNSPFSGTCFLIIKTFSGNEKEQDYRYVIQKCIDFNNVKNIYTRIIDRKNNNFGEWKNNSVDTEKIINKAITRDKLDDSFLSSDIFLKDTDINTINKDGAFVCVNCNNAPNQETYFLFNICLKNDTGEIRWTIQYLHSLLDGTMYYRTVDTGKNFATEWIKVAKSENKYVSKLQGKTWMFFGDSITEGVGTTDESTQSYPARIGAKFGINAINKAISGASWQTDGQYDDICVLTQIKNADLTNVDYCTIFAGTNDFGRGCLPIGKVDDTCTNTMQGAINNAIKMLIEKKPNIKIGIITPMWRERMSGGDDKESDSNTLQGHYLREYVDAVIESAKHNHIPVLNLYDNCGINKYNYNIFMYDGLHCNSKGYDEILSEKIHDFGVSIF